MTLPTGNENRHFICISTDRDTGEIRGRRQKKTHEISLITYHGKFETYSLKVFEPIKPIIILDIT